MNRKENNKREEKEVRRGHICVSGWQNGCRTGTWVWEEREKYERVGWHVKKQRTDKGRKGRDAQNHNVT